MEETPGTITLWSEWTKGKAVAYYSLLTKLKVTSSRFMPLWRILEEGGYLGVVCLVVLDFSISGSWGWGHSVLLFMIHCRYWAMQGLSLVYLFISSFYVFSFYGSMSLQCEKFILLLGIFLYYIYYIITYINISGILFLLNYPDLFEPTDIS